MLRRTLIALIAVLFAVGITSVAVASSVHLKGGSHAEPAFIDNGLTLSVAGELSGLGNADVFVTLSATGNPTATCTNPGSDTHQPAGQNPAAVTLTGTVAIPKDEIKNGNTPFGVAPRELTTDAPTTPVSGAPDCSNPNWTEDITDVAFTSATITVEQPPGTVVLTVTCTFASPTSDGAVDSKDVSCTSS
jgi:hypothetical protein